MKNRHFFLTNERGQVLPLVVIMLFAMLAMVVVLLDGGFLMYNRRVAQVAADAGALAGARELCLNNSTGALQAANNYAYLNQATTVNPTVSNGVITVNTAVQNASFFAKIFGVPTLNSKAVASAGCFYPSQGNHFLPVAWACKEPSDANHSSSPDCVLHYLDWPTQLQPIVNNKQPTAPIIDYDNGSTIYVTVPINFATTIIPKYIYVIMDSTTTNLDIASGCAAGYLSCLGGEFSGGDRGWLDLNGGGGGASELVNWIDKGYPGILTTHTWVPDQTGNMTSVYHQIQQILNTVVLVPVFNGTCDHQPTSQADPCITALHPSDSPVDNISISGGGNSAYFHINGFSALYITCVSSSGQNKCPGAKILINHNSALKNNDASVEGYFVANYPFDLGNPGSGGANVGVNIVSLTK